MATSFLFGLWNLHIFIDNNFIKLYHKNSALTTIKTLKIQY